MHRFPVTRRPRTGLAILCLLLLAAAAPLRTAIAQPDPRYYRYDQVVAQLQEWQQQYPDIFHMEPIGYTLVGGEPIWAARISDHASVREPEATLILHAAQHSNEPNGTGTIMILMNRLLTGYGHESRITNIVNRLQIWFIPIVNVDGHRMVFDGGPNWNLWRKDKRDNNGDELYTCPEDGVDLNRNWDFNWDQQGDSSSASQYYRGPYPFSEPEVVGLRDFILREQPLIVIDYHSPFQNSPGNVIYWTWAKDESEEYGPDRPFFEPIAHEIATRTQSEVDTVWYHDGAASQQLSKEQNWVYANTGDCVFLMEISSRGFWQDATVDSVAARAARGSFYVLDRAHDGPGLTGNVVDNTTGRPLHAEVEIEEAREPGIGPHMTDPQNGCFWRLLTEGTYTVSASAPGYRSRTITAYVTSGWTFTNIRLNPLDAAGADVDPRSGPARRPVWIENPASGGVASVHFRVTGAVSPVRLDILDVSGRYVRTLADGRFTSGVHEARLRNVSSGLYLLRLYADGRTTVRKVTIRR